MGENEVQDVRNGLAVEEVELKDSKDFVEAPWQAAGPTTSSSAVLSPCKAFSPFSQIHASTPISVFVPLRYDCVPWT